MCAADDAPITSSRSIRITCRTSLYGSLAPESASIADELAGFIDLRIDGLREALAHLAKHRDESLANPHVPGRARFIFDHSQAHLEAELTWTRELRTELRERASLDGEGEPE